MTIELLSFFTFGFTLGLISSDLHWAYLWRKLVNKETRRRVDENNKGDDGSGENTRGSSVLSEIS